MKKIAQDKKGEVFISLFRQEALRKLWKEFYAPASELVGEPDLERIDFEKGIFRSKTNYLSKWWTKNERQEIRGILGEEIIKEILGPSFYILHVHY